MRRPWTMGTWLWIAIAGPACSARHGPVDDDAGTLVESSGPPGSATETAAEPDACPLEALAGGDCQHLDDTCNHGDFVCECECFCDRGGGEPDAWECELARQDILTLDDASITIDCSSGTVAPSGTFLVDHTNGSAPLELTLHGYYSISGMGFDCGAFCSDCDPIATVVVAAGETETIEAAFTPGACEQDAAGAVCDACDGAVAQLGIYWVAAADGASQGDGQIFEDVPVVCD